MSDKAFVFWKTNSRRARKKRVACVETSGTFFLLSRKCDTRTSFFFVNIFLPSGPSTPVILSAASILYVVYVKDKSSCHLRFFKLAFHLLFTINFFAVPTRIFFKGTSLCTISIDYFFLQIRFVFK